MFEQQWLLGGVLVAVGLIIFVIILLLIEFADLRAQIGDGLIDVRIKEADGGHFIIKIHPEDYARLVENTMPD